MKSDDKHSDHDLKAYLDGRDGVSAAYRKAATEEPPRALDQAILDAARKRAQPPAEAWYAKRRPYALAASVMLGVLAVSLYFNALDEVAVPAAVEEATVRAVQIQNPERAAETKPEEVTAGAAASAEVEAEAPLQFETRRLAPAVPTAGAADTIAAPATPAVELNRDAFARAAEPARVVITGALLEEIEADAAQAQRQGLELQEITVTGSRILRRETGDLSYRNARATWLDEIGAMAQEFAARSRLVTARAAAARIEQQLDEEIALYLAAYPDADIEAELKALEE